MNPVENELKLIRDVCKKNGKVLHRYETNSQFNRHIKRITYASHSEGLPRPRRSTLCDGDRVLLNAIEGKSKNCEAYRKLNEFRKNLEPFHEKTI